MEVPGRNRCLALLREHRVPKHIVSHSLRVAQVGIVIASHLRTAGEDLDIGLVEAGGLLHDITKMDSIRTGQDHALSAFRLLESEGYPAVGNVARQHVFLDEDIRDNSRISEVLVVFYADKRVKHTTVVSLSERLEDLFARYGTTLDRTERLKEYRDQAEDIESRIFAGLDIGPAVLNGLNTIDPTEVVNANKLILFGKD